MSVHDEIAAMFSRVERSRDDMHGYQNEAVTFGKANPFSLLLIDMGLGKTVSSLSIINDIVLETDFQAAPILVIAPLKVARNVWPNEIKIWQHTAWMNAVLIRVDDDDPRLIEPARLDRANKEVREQQRRELVKKEMSKGEILEALGPTFKTQKIREIMASLARSNALVHVINRENTEWLVNLHREKWPYRTVFIDESDSFQDHKSDRFKALAKVKHTPGLITRMHLLTATPASESYLNLWSQVYLLDLGKRLGKSITKYRAQWFDHNKYNHTYKIKDGAEEAILERIADIAIVMKQKDYLPRDEPTIKPTIVDLSPRELAMVKSLERDLILQLPNEVELEAKTAAHLGNMLLQLASGAMYETLLVEQGEDEDFKKVKRTHLIHDHKIEALREIADQYKSSGKPLLVAYHFKSSLDRLKKAFPKAVTMSKDGREEGPWNKGKIQMMFIHPQSAGHGLNLQHGGSNLVFFDLIYSLRYYLQTIGRIDRQGQKNPVYVQVLIARGTRDEDAFAALRRKEDGQEVFFAILQRLIAKLRKKRAVLN